LGDTTTAVAIKELYSTSPQLYSDFSILPTDLDLDFALQFAGRHIKPRGLHFLALLLSPQATAYFLQALEAKKLDKVGVCMYYLKSQAGTAISPILPQAYRGMEY